MRKVKYHPKALAEAFRSANYYDRQRTGLGAEFFDASCIGAKIADPEPRRGIHLNQSRVGKKQELNVIPKSQARRCHNGLDEIAVVHGNFPVRLPDNPRLEFLPLFSVGLDRLDGLDAATRLAVHAVGQPATFRQCQRCHGLCGNAGAGAKQQTKSQGWEAPGADIQSHVLEPSHKLRRGAQSILHACRWGT